MNSIQLVVGIGTVFYVATCIAFFDIARKDFGSIGKKAMWGIIAFVPFVGVIIYLLFGVRKGIKPGRTDSA